jgi:hypothetical protein
MFGLFVLAMIQETSVSPGHGLLTPKTFLSYSNFYHGWKSIPADIRSAFERLFCLPTVQAVSLEFIREFPPQLLVELMRLKRLSLSFVEVDSKDIHCHLAVSELRELHLRGTPPPTIATITRCLPQSSPTLRRLAITPTLEPGFCTAISELMIAVGSNITHFEWLPSIHFCMFFFSLSIPDLQLPPAAPSSVPLDITRLPHLRFLRFSITFRNFRSNRNHFTEVLHLLDQVSTYTDNKIEIIELEFKFIRLFDNKVLKTQWRPLEKVLDKVGFRSSLKEVRVKLSANSNRTSDRYKTAIGFMDLFPSLRERGVIIIIMVSDSCQWNESSGHSY